MTLSEPYLCGSEEDHSFRSNTIHWVLQQRPANQRQGCVQNEIPRVVVQYWHDLEQLPRDVEDCLDSWRQLACDGFERELFDDRRARRFIAENYDPDHVLAFDRCYHPAMRCDYFRLCYILKRGGFYVDADEVYRGGGCDGLFQDANIKLQPLCYDTSNNSMVAPEDFLHDTNCPSSRIFYVNNNPLIAPPDHSLVRLALSRSTRLLLQSSQRLEIQSTTGPGNLSASLVRYVVQLHRTRSEWDFTVLRNWDAISLCRWFLSYRYDERNWRLLKSDED